MKLFVVGGRNMNAFGGEQLKAIIDRFGELGVTSIITDAKKGAGKFAEMAAEFVGLPTQIITNWKDSVVECDELLYIGGGKWGSQAQINLAEKLGKKVNDLYSK